MRLKTSFILICLLSHFLAAQSDKNVDDGILNELVQDKLFDHAHISLSVVDLKTDKEILNYNSEKPYIPASSLKLISNFSALKELGKDFKFKTSIYYRGDLSYDGTLKGDLLIIAGGDPTLGSFNFKGVLPLEALLSKISNDFKKAGISCIEGNIIIDDSFYSDQGPIDSWPIQ